MQAPDDDLCYRVERWARDGSRVEQLLVASCDLLAARAAFEALAQRKPGECITLRHKARVIEQTDGG